MDDDWLIVLIVFDWFFLVFDGISIGLENLEAWFLLNKPPELFLPFCCLQVTRGNWSKSPNLCISLLDLSFSSHNNTVRTIRSIPQTNYDCRSPMAHGKHVGNQEMIQQIKKGHLNGMDDHTQNLAHTFPKMCTIAINSTNSSSPPHLLTLYMRFNDIFFWVMN